MKKLVIPAIILLASSISLTALAFKECLSLYDAGQNAAYCKCFYTNCAEQAAKRGMPPQVVCSVAGINTELNSPLYNGNKTKLCNDSHIPGISIEDCVKGITDYLDPKTHC